MAFIKALERVFVNLLDRTGFSEIVGGRRALEAGLEDLRAGVLPMVAELLQVQQRKDSLARAVFDSEGCPHLARLHGWFGDIMKMAVPGELLPWVRRLFALGPALADEHVARLLATVAFRSPSPAERAIGRLVLFEFLCMSQRIQLLAADVDVEAIGGRPEEVEAIAEQELVAVEARPEYGKALDSLDDPLATLRVLLGASATRLGVYVEQVRREVARVGRELAERLQTRQELLQLLNGVDPTDALLIRNAHAEAFGGERLTVEQLRLRHPGLLGEVSSAAARKRLERVVRRRLDAGSGKPVTFGDLLLEQMKELER